MAIAMRSFSFSWVGGSGTYAVTADCWPNDTYIDHVTSAGGAIVSLAALAVLESVSLASITATLQAAAITASASGT